jgi:hypothetical protein
VRKLTWTCTFSLLLRHKTEKSNTEDINEYFCNILNKIRNVQFQEERDALGPDLLTALTLTLNFTLTSNHTKKSERKLEIRLIKLRLDRSARFTLNKILLVNFALEHLQNGAKRRNEFRMYHLFC